MIIGVAIGAAVLVLVEALTFGLLVAARKENLVLARVNDATEARNADLHNRLAARTYGEYAAFTEDAGPRPAPDGPDYVFDETGLMAFVADERDDDGAA